jgi:uncharacterized radical SAM superfamily Fe-S cluster-containing enzyme
MVLIAILFILPLPTQAQSLGMDVAILGEILNVLKEMRNDELKSIKNSETSPRNQHEEFLTTEQSKPIGEAENIKKLIEAAEGNAKETNKNINSQLERIKNLHQVMIDKKNIDGLLKVEQLQLQLQSINASINTTNNQIQLDKFKTETVVRKIQHELKEKNRKMYIEGDHQRVPVNFKGQFFLGHHNNQP